MNASHHPDLVSRDLLFAAAARILLSAAFTGAQWIRENRASKLALKRTCYGPGTTNMDLWVVRQPRDVSHGEHTRRLYERLDASVFNNTSALRPAEMGVATSRPRTKFLRFN